MKNVMVGRYVPLMRNLRRRSDRAGTLRKSGLSSTVDLRKKYLRYVDGPDTKEANAALNEINGFAEQGVRSVKGSKK